MMSSLASRIGMIVLIFVVTYAVVALTAWLAFGADPSSMIVRVISFIIGFSIYVAWKRTRRAVRRVTGQA